jgi:hypothetical protein
MSTMYIYRKQAAASTARHIIGATYYSCRSGHDLAVGMSNHISPHHIPGKQALIVGTRYDNCLSTHHSHSIYTLFTLTVYGLLYRFETTPDTPPFTALERPPWCVDEQQQG